MNKALNLHFTIYIILSTKAIVSFIESLEGLPMRILKCHLIEKEQKFECYACGKEFDSLNHLRSHFNTKKDTECKKLHKIDRLDYDGVQMISYCANEPIIYKHGETQLYCNLCKKQNKGQSIHGMYTHLRDGCEIKNTREKLKAIKKRNIKYYEKDKLKKRGIIQTEEPSKKDSSSDSSTQSSTKPDSSTQSSTKPDSTTTIIPTTIIPTTIQIPPKRHVNCQKCYKKICAKQDFLKKIKHCKVCCQQTPGENWIDKHIHFEFKIPDAESRIEVLHEDEGTYSWYPGTVKNRNRHPFKLQDGGTLPRGNYFVFFDDGDTTDPESPANFLRNEYWFFQ